MTRQRQIIHLLAVSEPLTYSEIYSSIKDGGVGPIFSEIDKLLKIGFIKPDRPHSILTQLELPKFKLAMPLSTIEKLLLL